MHIYSMIKSDLANARKKGYKNVTEDLKVIMGELARLKGTKVGKQYITSDLTDEQVIKILISIIKAEDKNMELTGTNKSSLKIIAQSYLPELVSKEELLAFIGTIDFSKFKNKMQAVGIVKKHFGINVDAKLVSDIISQNY